MSCKPTIIYCDITICFAIFSTKEYKKNNILLIFNNCIKMAKPPFYHLCL